MLRKNSKNKANRYKYTYFLMLSGMIYARNKTLLTDYVPVGDSMIKIAAIEDELMVKETICQCIRNWEIYSRAETLYLLDIFDFTHRKCSRKL